MIKKYKHILSVALVLLCALYADAKSWKCDLPLPYLHKGCDGVGCDLLTYDKAISNVDVYEKPNLKSKILGKIKKCETLKSVEGYKMIEEFGTLQINVWPESYKDVSVKHKDTVEFLNYKGEGGYEVCIHKKNYEIYSSLASQEALRRKRGYKFKLLDFDYAMPISSGKSQEWYKVKAASGLEGFVPYNEEKLFFIPYSAYQEGMFCQEDTALGLNEKEIRKKMAAIVQVVFKKHHKQIVEECGGAHDHNIICPAIDRIVDEVSFDKVVPPKVNCKLLKHISKSSMDVGRWNFSVLCEYKLERNQVPYTNSYGIQCDEKNNGRLLCF